MPLFAIDNPLQVPRFLVYYQKVAWGVAQIGSRNF